MVRIRSESKDVSKNINRVLLPLVRLCELRDFLYNQKEGRYMLTWIQE